MTVPLQSFLREIHYSSLWHVDKLAKAQRLSGQKDWIFIHIEAQISRGPQFARRKYVYNYRIFDRYTKPVASMAVLGDDDPRRCFHPGSCHCQQFPSAGRPPITFPCACIANAQSIHPDIL